MSNRTIVGDVIEKIEGFNPVFTRNGHVFFDTEEEEFKYFTEPEFNIYSDGSKFPSYHHRHKRHKCLLCGKYLKAKVHVPNNTVEYMEERTFKEFTPGRSFDSHREAWEFQHEHYPKRLVPTTTCVVHEIREAGMIATEIDVPTGELLFINFFAEDNNHHVPNEYDSENSICHLGGEKNLAEHLAKRNIGFGQMGNMYITVFTKGDDEILIGDEDKAYRFSDDFYDYDPVLYEKAIKVYDGVKKHGDISLDMWRWCCADKSLIKELGEEEHVEKKMKQGETVTVSVPKGRYRIEHYYGIDRSQIVYSRLKRVGNISY